MTSVNTNVGAVVASANIEKIGKELDTAIARLSSGLRINSAKDDSAGMAIASKMESQITGLNQAVRNATDSQALIDTTEGAQVEVVNILQRLRELAVQSANDSNTALDRSFINTEATQLIAEVDRIANQTSWNQTNVLDGTFTSKQFQLGANANETVSFSVDSVKSADIGNFRVNGTSSLTAAADDTIDAHTMTVTGNIGTSAISVVANSSAGTVASQVNSVSASTGVTATAINKVKMHSLSASGTLAFTLGNDASSGGSASISVTVNDKDDLRVIKDAINAVAGTTGISAEVHTDGNAALVLTHSTGEDIKITSYNHGVDGSTLDIQSLDQDGSALTSSATQSDTVILSELTADVDHLFDGITKAVNTSYGSVLNSGVVNGFVTALTLGGTTAGAIEIVGTNGIGTAITETLTLGTTANASVTSVNSFATVSTVTQRTALVTSGTTIDIGVLSSTNADAIGQVRFNSGNTFNVASSVVTNNNDNFLATTAANTSSLSALSTVALGTAAGAATAIDILDGAIAKINDQRATLGAISNRLDSTVSNLTNIITNTEASVSNIRDADFSVETSRLTRAQILNQAATSMLAQANASKQSVLSLLQG
jgi:flagellin